MESLKLASCEQQLFKPNFVIAQAKKNGVENRPVKVIERKCVTKNLVTT